MFFDISCYDLCGLFLALSFVIDKQLILPPVSSDPLVIFDVRPDCFIRSESPFLRPGTQPLFGDVLEEGAMINYSFFNGYLR